MEKKAKTIFIVTLALVIVIAVSIFVVIAASPKVACRDGKDNDGDTFIDLKDPGCSSKVDKSELGSTQCDDGIDNVDSDTLVDYPNDPGCSSPSDNDEISGQCDDTLDNDNDGYKDLVDSKCSGFTDNDESPRDFCNDSDNGNIFNVKGIVSGEDNSIFFNHTDECISAVMLREYKCGSKSVDYNPLTQDFDCSQNATNSSCSNGACV